MQLNRVQNPQPISYVLHLAAIETRSPQQLTCLTLDKRFFTNGNWFLLIKYPFYWLRKYFHCLSVYRLLIVISLGCMYGIKNTTGLFILTCNSREVIYRLLKYQLRDVNICAAAFFILSGSDHPHLCISAILSWNSNKITSNMYRGFQNSHSLI